VTGILAVASEAGPGMGDWARLLGLAFTAAVGYRVSLWIWPYTYCRKCGGSGRNSGSNRRRFGACPRCGGSGRKERFGVRLFVRRD
jgi:DnaJ-class molecular chaperone